MIKKFIKEKIFNPVSMSAVDDVINADDQLKECWDYSLQLFPDFSKHFAIDVHCKEVEKRIRFLVVVETIFMKKVMTQIKTKGKIITYADIGDSDGSVRLLINKYFSNNDISSVGINLQQSAVKKIKEQGLDAICADALSLGKQGINYDIVSLFETLEHLPDPIGFLNGVKDVTNNRLVISVPYVSKSRVSLRYIENKWPYKKNENEKITIENTHIFELSPKDWNKIFLHTGWKIDQQMIMKPFPKYKISRLLLQPFWKFISFDGFWFVSLSKDDTLSKKYTIE